MTENLIIEGTVKTPSVKLLGDTGVLELSGKSIPENSIAFYQPLLTWIDNYSASPQPQTEMRISLEYFNTSSSKCLLDMLRKLEAVKRAGKSDITVMWCYEPDDEDMMEAGQDYDSLVDLTFKIVQL